MADENIPEEMYSIYISRYIKEYTNQSIHPSYRKAPVLWSVMNLFPEHKGNLKCYAVAFLLLGFVLLVCGAMFESESSTLGKHQETTLRQDQVHYWAGIPFIIHGLASVLFILLEVNCMLKFCICMDYICLNIAIFVIIVEGPDWNKYRAKAFYYDTEGDIDYKMLKPAANDFGMHDALTRSNYSGAMMYSGTWVFIAICSILLCVETFLMHLKVYCGIQSIYAYLSGYELVSPIISLKTAKPVEKFKCKGCQTKLSPYVITPQTPITEAIPTMPIPPPTIEDEMPQSIPDGLPLRSASPTPSDTSSIVSNAFFVCQEGAEIKLVGYKPRRRGGHVPQLCTHHEDEEGPTDHYHFAKKHPNKYESPSESPKPNDPQVSPSFPRPPPLSLMIPPKGPATGQFSRSNSPSELNYPGRRRSSAQSPLVSPFIPIAPSPPPLPLQMQSGNRGNRSPAVDRSPGKYPFMADIFPPPPSTLPGMRQGRRVSFANDSGEPESPTTVPSSPEKLDTLI